MLLIYVAYTLFLFTARADMEEQYGFRRFLNYLFRFQYILTIKHGVLSGLGRSKAGDKKIERVFREGVAKELLVMLIAGAAIACGADLFIGAAVHFAGLLKVPSVLVGASVVALGTWLPK